MKTEWGDNLSYSFVYFIISRFKNILKIIKAPTQSLEIFFICLFIILLFLLNDETFNFVLATTAHALHAFETKTGCPYCLK